MRYKHLFWAIILIMIGVLFIFRNLNILHFTWLSFWKLWPLILLFWGIAILPIRDGIKYALLGAVILFTFLFINRLTESNWFLHFRNDGNNFGWHWNDKGDRDWGSTNYKDQNLTVPFDSSDRKGVLELDAAAGNFFIMGNTGDFLSFSKTGDIGNYELTTNVQKRTRTVSLRLQEGGSAHRLNKNRVEIKLNPKPAWNLKLDIGAADMELDLTAYKIDTATIDAGASSINVKLGDTNPFTHFTFNAGASSIKVSVPKDAGCQVSSESFLASRDFEGFKKTGDHTWETENYAAAKNKFEIVVKTAVSSIEINRY